MSTKPPLPRLDPGRDTRDPRGAVGAGRGAAMLLERAEAVKRLLARGDAGISRAIPEALALAGLPSRERGVAEHALGWKRRTSGERRQEGHQAQPPAPRVTRWPRSRGGRGTRGLVGGRRPPNVPEAAMPPDREMLEGAPWDSDTLHDSFLLWCACRVIRSLGFNMRRVSRRSPRNSDATLHRAHLFGKREYMQKLGSRRRIWPMRSGQHSLAGSRRRGRALRRIAAVSAPSCSARAPARRSSGLARPRTGARAAVPDDEAVVCSL